MERFAVGQKDYDRDLALWGSDHYVGVVSVELVRIPSALLAADAPVSRAGVVNGRRSQLLLVSDCAWP